MKSLIYKIVANIYKIQQSNPKLISTFDSHMNDPMPDGFISKLENLNLDRNFIDLYKTFNGVTIDWIHDQDRGIRGKMELLPIAEVIKSWQGYLYDEDDDIAEDAEIKIYHPFDLISEEAQCGILIDPNGGPSTIGYNYSGEMEVEPLNLDFKSYLEMAVEAHVFSYWPKVLIDIENDQNSPEVEMFTEYMPKIFKEFHFEKFIEKYQSLKLS